MAVLHDSALLPGTPGPAAPLRPWVLGEDGRVDLARRPAPGEPPPDHFAVLGLPKRLGLDPQHLEVTFRSLVRGLHPDRFHLQGPEAVRQAEWHTSLVNDAWRTLRHFERRVAYVLELAGDDKAEAEKFRPPAALLAQVFELNEALDAATVALAEGDDEAMAEAREQVDEAAAAIQADRRAVTAQLEAAARRWDAAQAASELDGHEVPDLIEARKALRAALGHARYLDNLLVRMAATVEPEAQALHDGAR